jgi:MFS family permease
MPKKPEAAALSQDSHRATDLQTTNHAAEAPEVAKTPEAAKAAETAEAGLGDILPKVFPVIALHFVFYLCFTVYLTNSSVYIITEHSLGTSAQAGLIGFTTTLFTMLIGVTYRIWGRLFKKWMVLASYALACLGFVLMLSVTTTLVGIWSGAILLIIGLNLSNPYVASHTMSLVPPKLIPVAMALYTGFMNLSMFAAPYLSGFFGDFLGGGVTGALRFATLLLPFCAIGAIYLFVFSDKSAPPRHHAR